MKSLKIITDESINKKDSKKMMESDSIIDFKKAGENYAIEKGVTEISLADCTPPTMGDRKIADRNIKDSGDSIPVTLCINIRFVPEYGRRARVGQAARLAERESIRSGRRTHKSTVCQKPLIRRSEQGETR